MALIILGDPEQASKFCDEYFFNESGLATSHNKLFVANLKRIRGLALLLNDYSPMPSNRVDRLQKASRMTDEATRIYKELEDAG